MPNFTWFICVPDKNRPYTKIDKDGATVSKTVVTIDACYINVIKLFLLAV